jgi:hypothetical protein
MSLAEACRPECAEVLADRWAWWRAFARHDLAHIDLAGEASKAQDGSHDIEWPQYLPMTGQSTLARKRWVDYLCQELNCSLNIEYFFKASMGIARDIRGHLRVVDNANYSLEQRSRVARSNRDAYIPPAEELAKIAFLLD